MKRISVTVRACSLTLCAALLAGCSAPAAGSVSAAQEPVSTTATAEPAATSTPAPATPEPTAAVETVPAADAAAAAVVGTMPETVTSYYNYSQENGSQRIPVYAEADTAAAQVAEVPASGHVWLLADQGEWLYILWGSQYGWVQSSALPRAEGKSTNSFSMPLPQFLSDEQKLEFLRATELFDAYLCHNFGLDMAYDETKEAPGAGSDSNPTYARDAAWSSYADFDAALNEVFTPEYLASISAANDEPVYTNLDDQVYLIQADRGCWTCQVASYTPTEQTDERIAFDVELSYPTPVQDHRCTLPVVMEKSADGLWRFSKFTSYSDDINWMAAMGSDFDPWEGQE
jgi:hypothetical protein